MENNNNMTVEEIAEVLEGNEELKEVLKIYRSMKPDTQRTFLKFLKLSPEGRMKLSSALHIVNEVLEGKKDFNEGLEIYKSMGSDMAELYTNVLEMDNEDRIAVVQALCASDLEEYK